MRLLTALLSAAAALSLAAPAGAAVRFTAGFSLVHSVNAHVEPDGEFVSVGVPPTAYSGTFEFDLASASETVTDLGGGQQLRTIDVAFTFDPFRFAPDLDALVDVGDIPAIGPLTSNSQGFIHAVRLETTGGALLSLQEMSNVFGYSQGRFSLADGDSVTLYRGVRANLDEAFTSVGSGLASSSAADIAAYLEGSTQLWSIGSSTAFAGPRIAPPTVHGGINFAGLLSFDNVTFEDDAVVTPPGVPEPAAWALMIAGFGAAGVSLRRRHHGAAAACAAT